MLKETEIKETIVFFVTILSLVVFQLGGAGSLEPPGYAYALKTLKVCSNGFKTAVIFYEIKNLPSESYESSAPALAGGVPS